MANITYLIGAGASKKALPIVNEIPKRIEQMIGKLEEPNFKISPNDLYDGLPVKTAKIEVQQDFVKDLRWLNEKCLNHASIDTFAKKLFLQHKEELNRLKLAFSTYLILEQAKNKVDNRYDAFFASILTDSIVSFPTGCKILSWNYDHQFEKAYSEYLESTNIERVAAHLNVRSKFYESNNEKFSITKLNGTCGFYSTDFHLERQLCSDFSNDLDLPFLDKVMRNYSLIKAYPDRYWSALSFAWETLGKSDSIIRYAKYETARTDILVVIGYSFPYFNREADRALLENMAQLQRVYFQSPDAENIKERFLSIRSNIKSDNLLCRTNTDQFLFPNEL